MKTLGDYISWRNKEPPAPPANEWRPPVLAKDFMYDMPQNRVFSPLDSHPIIQRVLINPKVPAPTAFPIWGTKGYQFFAGLWTGAMLTMVFTCKTVGRKEVQDLVMYDPAYFPEFAKKGTA
ncbi:hypothetical protein V8C86DRAFT_366287 [Haematococcus lacustris]|nr:hypothetical protein QJQ45_009182 [Haematococcus lacustris]